MDEWVYHVSHARRYCFDAIDAPADIGLSRQYLEQARRALDLALEQLDLDIVLTACDKAQAWRTE